jgi:hypothetical protein
VNISINNSNSTLGSVTSLQITNTVYTQRQVYFETGADDVARVLVGISNRDASVGELSDAIATVGDMLGAAELTLRDIDALVNERFWRRLNLSVEAEFVVISTGHGLVEGGNARLLVKTDAQRGEVI